MDNKTFTRKDLEDLIKDMMGISEITPMITAHINTLILNYDMSFKEIARCIVFYNEELGMSLSPVYGIKFVLNVREQAAKYFTQLELDKKSKEKEALKIAEYQENNIIINIKSFKHKKREPRKFNIADIKIDEGGSDNE